MGFKDLTIKLKLDRSDAKAATAGHVADAKKMETATRDAVRGGARESKAATADMLADFKAAENTKGTIQVQAVRDAKGRFVALGQASKETMASMGEDAKVAAGAVGTVGSGVLGLTGTLGGLAVGKEVFSGISGAAQTFLGILNQANVEASKQVDKLLQTKDLLRDIAGMTGSKVGSSDAEVQKHIDIRTATGLGDAAAHAFVEQYAGAGEAKKGINISPEEYEKSKPLLARFAASKSGDDPGAVGAYGNLAGLMLGYGKNQTAGGMLAGMTNVNDILNMGVGDNPTLIREFAQQAGSLLNAEGTGYGGDPNKLAALIATSSIQRSPGQSGTVVQQASKVLRGFDAKQGTMLADAGITPKDNMPEALDKLFVSMKAAEDKGIAPDQFLTKGGVESDEDRRSLAALYAGREYTAKFIKAGAAPPTEPEARAKLERVYQADTGLQSKVQEAKLDEGKQHNAMLLQHARPLQMEAEAKLQERGEGADSGWAGWGDWFRGTGTSGGGLFLPSGMSRQDLGRKIRVEQTMFDLAKEKGVDIPDRPPVSSPLGGYSSQYFAWLTSGEMEQSYSQAMGTKALGQQVGEPVDKKTIEANTRATEALTAEMKARRVQPPTTPPTAPPVNPNPRLRPVNDRGMPARP